MPQQPDQLDKGLVNSFYVGTKQGTATRDHLSPGDDGYDHVRTFTRQGTQTRDGLEAVEG